MRVGNLLGAAIACLAVAPVAQAQVKDDGPSTADEANAAPARTIGLRDALSVAVRQNPSLATATMDVAIADSQIDETYGLDDYVFDSSANWLSQRTAAVSTNPFQQTALDDFKLHAGITRAFSDGGRLGVRLDGEYTRTITRLQFSPAMPAENIETTIYKPSVQATFFQPLLKGFGKKVARANRRLAEANRTVAELTREGDAANVVRDVVSAYWELAYAAQDLEIRRAAVTLAKEQLRLTQASIDVGKLAKTEALSVEQAIAAREEEVLLAEQTLSERSLEVRRLAGLEIGPGEIDLAASDKLDVTAAVPSVDEALKKAMERNPQLVTIRAQAGVAAIDVEVNEDGLLPQLDFNAAAGPLGNSTGAGDSFAQMAEFKSWQVNATVNLTMPLENRQAKAALATSKGRLRKVKLSEADVSSQIAVQVVRAVNGVRSASKRIEVTATSTKLAKQNVDVEQARWEVGRSTNFDVIKRQEELEEAQLREARARADYLKALAVLQALDGDLLPQYGITVAVGER